MILSFELRLLSVVATLSYAPTSPPKLASRSGIISCLRVLKDRTFSLPTKIVHIFKLGYNIPNRSSLITSTVTIFASVICRPLSTVRTFARREIATSGELSVDMEASRPPPKPTCETTKYLKIVIKIGLLPINLRLVTGRRKTELKTRNRQVERVRTRKMITPLSSRKLVLLGFVPSSNTSGRSRFTEIAVIPQPFSLSE